MASWSELPRDLLWLIANFLVTYTDQVCFACVCTSWRSILPTISGKHIQPWLLLPRKSKNEKYEKFYSLHGGKVHYLEVPEEVLIGKKFRGSSHGWLVSIEIDSPRISLFNPITRAQIALPPRYEFADVTKYCPEKLDAEYVLQSYDLDFAGTYSIEASHVHEFFLGKVILSSSPTTSNSKDNFMVVAIYSTHGNLAYCKLGDKRWTSIYEGSYGYKDAIFCEGKLYALTNRCGLDVYEFSTAYPKKIESVEPPKVERHPQLRYLVNTSVGLLQVHRYTKYLSKNHYKTTHFDLYKYESSSESWCKVKNIGENVLFLGLNASISLASNCLPPTRHYKGNRIFFTDNNMDQWEVGVGGGHDIGCYDLDRRLTVYLQCDGRGNHRKWTWPTPIWYIYNPEDFINEQS